MDENSPPDQKEVVNLLEKLGNSEVNYPPELMRHARAAFNYKVAAVKAQMLDGSTALSESQAAGYGSIAESGKTVFAWQTALKMTVAIALVTAMAYGAYLLSDFLPPSLDQPSSTPVYVTPAGNNEIAPVIVETIEATETPFAPALLVENTPERQSTPDPDDSSEREHPGRHLGQTPGPPNAPGQTKTPKTP